jgi:hypothetical protein
LLQQIIQEAGRIVNLSFLLKKYDENAVELGNDLSGISRTPKGVYFKTDS